MDGHRFDELTRALGARPTRRDLLAGLLGAAVGLGLGPSPVRAACPPDQAMRRGLGCVCRTTGRPPTGDGCPCPSGQTRCGGGCVDLANDPAHCGACDAACPADASVAEFVCRRGQCQVGTCAPGLANCAGDLTCATPLGTDADCGGCGDACAGTGVTCGGGGTPGVCGCTDDGLACGDAVCGTAVNNCGAEVSCGPLGGGCQAGQACERGRCACTPASCPNGCCDESGLCRIDDAACGSGGAACVACTGTGESCGGGGVAGVCGCTDNGEACGDAVCGTARNNCGDEVACGPLGGDCLAGQACESGQCVCTSASCPTGCCDQSNYCHVDEDLYCGYDGGDCTVCFGTGVTCGGGGTAGVCGCTPLTTCPADKCDTTIPDRCGGQVECPPCPKTVTFGFSGKAESWTVPAGVTQATFELFGAPAYGGLGKGGRTKARLKVEEGELYEIVVGGMGGDVSLFSGAGGGGGFGGGGKGGDGVVPGGGGGGASWVFRNGIPLLVAGGGGGSIGVVWDRVDLVGGGGGGTAGQDAAGAGGGRGGTQSAGGAGGASSEGAGAGAPGTFGRGGAGGNSSDSRGGGGGGGGYYGGGGGSGSDSGYGGGGGSGYITPDRLEELAFETAVYFDGDGRVTITYLAG